MEQEWTGLLVDPHRWPLQAARLAFLGLLLSCSFLGAFESEDGGFCTVGTVSENTLSQGDVCYVELYLFVLGSCCCCQACVLCVTLWPGDVGGGSPSLWWSPDSWLIYHICWMTGWPPSPTHWVRITQKGQVWSRTPLLNPSPPLYYCWKMRGVYWVTSLTLKYQDGTC